MFGVKANSGASLRENMPANALIDGVSEEAKEMSTLVSAKNASQRGTHALAGRRRTTGRPSPYVIYVRP